MKIKKGFDSGIKFFKSKINKVSKHSQQSGKKTQNYSYLSPFIPIRHLTVQS